MKVGNFSINSCNALSVEVYREKIYFIVNSISMSMTEYAAMSTKR